MLCLHPSTQAGAAAAAAKPKKKAKVKVKQEEGQPRGRQAAAGGEAPSRRSSRLREAAEHPKPKPETGGWHERRHTAAAVLAAPAPQRGQL